MKKLQTERYIGESLALTYLDIKKYVIEQGYSNEIDWQYTVNHNVIDDKLFLRETAWVTLNSGMKESVVRRIFPKICNAFLNWESIQLICMNSSQCRQNALRNFNHRGKIEAIIYIANFINDVGYQFIHKKIIEEGPSYLEIFPHIGTTTALHLAKNLGYCCIKPDRHLKRIAQTLGFDNPYKMCETISHIIDEQLSVVDIVLWRFATIEKNYLKKFQIV